jgi:hypothetical protein
MPKVKKKSKRKPRRIIAPIYKAELELYLFELRMIAEALEMSEKRRTDYIV